MDGASSWRFSMKLGVSVMQGVGRKWVEMGRDGSEMESCNDMLPRIGRLAGLHVYNTNHLLFGIFGSNNPGPWLSKIRRRGRTSSQSFNLVRLLVHIRTSYLTSK